MTLPFDLKKAKNLGPYSGPRSRRGGTPSVTEAELEDILKVLDEAAGNAIEFHRFENPGTTNKAHRVRMRIRTMLKRAEITGYDFWVEGGCALQGAKVRE